MLNPELEEYTGIEFEDLEAHLYGQIYHSNLPEETLMEPNISNVVDPEKVVTKSKRYYENPNLNSIPQSYQPHIFNTKDNSKPNENLPNANKFINPFPNKYQQFFVPRRTPAINNIMVFQRPPSRYLSTAFHGLFRDKEKMEKMKSIEKKERFKKKRKKNVKSKAKKNRTTDKPCNDKDNDLETENVNSSPIANEEILVVSDSDNSDVEEIIENNPIIILTDAEEENKKSDCTILEITANDESKIDKENLDILEDDNDNSPTTSSTYFEGDVIVVEKKLELEIISIDDECSLHEGSTSPDHESILNETDGKNTVADSHNDFLDRTDFNQTNFNFNFNLHGNDFDCSKLDNSSQEKVKNSNNIEAYETESSCSTVDVPVQTDKRLKEIRFDNPGNQVFDEPNLESFANFITPKRNTIKSPIAPKITAVKRKKAKTPKKKALSSNEKDKNTIRNEKKNSASLSESSKSSSLLKEKNNNENKPKQSKNKNYDKVTNPIASDDNNKKKIKKKKNSQETLNTHGTNKKKKKGVIENLESNSKKKKKIKQKKNIDSKNTENKSNKLNDKKTNSKTIKRITRKTDIDKCPSDNNLSIISSFSQSDSNYSFSTTNEKDESVKESNDIQKEIQNAEEFLIISDTENRSISRKDSIESILSIDDVGNDMQVVNVITHKEKHPEKSKNPPNKKQFSEFWNDDMKKFYSESWGHDDFSVVESQRAMTDKPEMWKVLDADRYMLIQERGPMCRCCRRRGHFAARCPERPNYITCAICGDRGHAEPRCPNLLCTTCGERTRYFTTYCSQCKGYKNLRCDICNMTGHLTTNCPDLWRRYHMTTKEGPLLRPGDDDLKPREKRWCSGCGSQGHYEYDCNYYNRTHGATKLSIQSYERVSNDVDYRQTSSKRPRRNEDVSYNNRTNMNEANVRHYTENRNENARRSWESREYFQRDDYEQQRQQDRFIPQSPWSNYNQELLAQRAADILRNNNIYGAPFGPNRLQFNMQNMYGNDRRNFFQQQQQQQQQQPFFPLAAPFAQPTNPSEYLNVLLTLAQLNANNNNNNINIGNRRTEEGGFSNRNILNDLLPIANQTNVESKGEKTEETMEKEDLNFIPLETKKVEKKVENSNGSSKSILTLSYGSTKEILFFKSGWGQRFFNSFLGKQKLHWKFKGKRHINIFGSRPVKADLNKLRLKINEFYQKSLFSKLPRKQKQAQELIREKLKNLKKIEIMPALRNLKNNSDLLESIKLINMYLNAVFNMKNGAIHMNVLQNFLKLKPTGDISTETYNSLSSSFNSLCDDITCDNLSVKSLSNLPKTIVPKKLNDLIWKPIKDRNAKKHLFFFLNKKIYGNLLILFQFLDEIYLEKNNSRSKYNDIVEKYYNQLKILNEQKLKSK